MFPDGFMWPETKKPDPVEELLKRADRIRNLQNKIDAFKKMLTCRYHYLRAGNDGWQTPYGMEIPSTDAKDILQTLLAKAQTKLQIEVNNA